MKKLPSQIYYYISYSLIPILGVIQTKALTMILSKASFGQIQLIMPIIGWGIIIGGLGLPQYVIRFYSVHGIAAFKKGVIISCIFIFLISPLFYLLYVEVGISKLQPHKDILLFFIIALIIILSSVLRMVNALLRVQQRHFLFNFILISERLFVLLAVLAGILLWSAAPVNSFFLGYALGVGGALFMVWVFLRKKIIWCESFPSLSQIKEMLLYGLPIITVLIMSDFLATLNRYIISYKLDVNAVAVFVIGVVITHICFAFLYEPILTYGHPFIFNAWEKSGKADTESIVNKYIKLYMMLGLLMLGIVVHFEDILINVVSNNQYRMPAGCFPMLAIASFVLGIYRFLVTHYLLRKNTSELILCFFISVVCSVVLALFLITYYGLVGVCAAALISTIVLCLIVWWRGRSVMQIQIISRQAYAIIPFTIILSIFNSPYKWDMFSIWRWVDFVFVLACALVILYFVNIRQYIDKKV